VLGGPAQSQNEIEEIPSSDPATASPIGYSQSKWVVEKICETASQLPDMDGRVRILRIGQLCGDTVTGYWNEKEGWPLLIRTAQTTGSLPDLTEVRPPEGTCYRS
jgi:thioester reductase-like protein